MKNSKFYAQCFLALLSGILLPFAFAPYEYSFLAVISSFLFFLSLQKKSPKAGFFIGLLYGIGCFGTGASWIYISIHTYGNTNVFLGMMITLSFVLYLALYPSLVGYILQKCSPDFNPPSPSPARSFFATNIFRITETSSLTRALIVFPVLSVIMEWFRSFVITGFPWLLLGYSQINSPLAGYIPLIGVYGSSFLVLFIAGTLYVFIKHCKNKFAAISIPLSLFLLYLTGHYLSFIHWTTPVSSSPLKISLIQANVPISMKWSEQYALKALSDYIFLSKQSISDASKDTQTLIVWPETAVTFFLDESMPLLTSIDKFAIDHNTAIITGIPIRENNLFYNGAVVLGKGNGIYLKRHLVPFGEYTPFQEKLGRLLNFLNLPMSDFSDGPEKQHLLKIFNIKAAALICYEVTYSDLWRSDLPDANLLVGLSNDSWFGKSIASAQQRQIAQFAALASGREMVVATNSGETVVINSHGKIAASLPINKTAVLESKIIPLKGATPWVRVGDTCIIVILIFLLSLTQIKNFHLKNRLFQRK